MCMSINPPGNPSDRNGTTARNAEQARQNAINNVIGRITKVFNPQGRRPLYAQAQQDSKNLMLHQLDRQRQDTTRSAMFNLARRGITGGSNDVNTNARILEDYNKGLLTAGNKAQTVGDNLRLQDGRTKNNLIAQARSGLSMTQAVQQALQGAQQNTAFATQSAQAQSIGNAFSNIAAANNGYQQAQGNTAANRLYAQNRYLGPGATKSTSKNGTISGTGG